MESRTEIRHGMRITWHQPVGMDDGIVLRADVYRPVTDGRYPVILSHGVYAKGLAYQDAKTFHYGTRGTGGMTHADPINRPRDVFGGTVTLHAGGARESYLLVPVIPLASSSHP